MEEGVKNLEKLWTSLIDGPLDYSAKQCCLPIEVKPFDQINSLETP